jgi:antirestriction protein
MIRKRKRKVRGDSKLHHLKPESRVLELRDLLLSGATYKEAKKWLWENCQVTTTGDALGRFWALECQPIKDEETSLTSAVAEGIIDRIGAVDWDSATEELMRQTTFELLSGQSVDGKTKVSYIREWNKLRSQKDASAKAQDAARTKEEAGIDALVEAARGDKEAEELLRKLNERLARKGGRA